MPSSSARLIGFVTVALCAAGCGGPNSLGGSASDLFPLAVSFTDVRTNSEAVQVSYYANRGTEIDLVIRLTVGVSDLQLHKGIKIPLQGELTPGHPRTTVVHLAAGEPERVFPAVSRGDLTLSELGDVGEPTRGDFSVSFVTGTEYGAGRSLYGNFLNITMDGGFGP